MNRKATPSGEYFSVVVDLGDDGGIIFFDKSF